MKNYIVWIESGCTNVALILKEATNSFKVVMPMCLVNTPMGETKDGVKVAPNSPDAVKIHYHTDMVPYVFAEMTGGPVPFVLNKANTKYALIDQNSNLAKQYELIMMNLMPGAKVTEAAEVADLPDEESVSETNA